MGLVGGAGLKVAFFCVSSIFQLRIFGGQANRQLLPSQKTAFGRPSTNAPQKAQSPQSGQRKPTRKRQRTYQAGWAIFIATAGWHLFNGHALGRYEFLSNAFSSNHPPLIAAIVKIYLIVQQKHCQDYRKA
jgi:hypothetical protein